jgi:hypothetical protein
MSDAIKLNIEKENSLTFQVNISGIDTTDIKVRFAIDTEAVCYMFPCEKVNEEEYKVVIPALKHIPHETYNCMIEVVANEFFFVAMNGKIKLVGTPKIKAKVKKESVEDNSDAPEIHITASPIKVEQLEEGKKRHKRDEEDEDEALDQSDTDDALEVQTDPGALTSESRDNAVKRILGELGYKYEPIKSGKSLKSYLKDG